MALGAVSRRTHIMQDACVKYNTTHASHTTQRECKQHKN